MRFSVRDHARVRSAFFRSLDLPSSEREDFVRRSLDERTELVRRVLTMLADAPDADVEPWDEPLLRQERLGDYRLIGLIGRGGTAVVLHAEHAATGREVALKLLPMGSASKDLRARLTREGEVLQALKHPNIARWRDGGVLHTPEGPRPFVAMDYFHGHTLLEWVHEESPTAARRLTVLEQLARAVAHAHENGVVHRDLKPSNVLVGAGDRVCVLDFGVARLLRGDDHTLTEAGQIVGTVRFLSPEQAAGDLDAIGPATDVHALGLLVHEVMAGAPPYEVPSNVAEALPAILNAVPARPAIENPRLRRAIDRICDAALARDPVERLADASLVAADLAAAREGRRVPIRRGRGRRRWHRVRRLVLAAAAILTVVVLDFALRPNGPEDPRVVMQRAETHLVEADRLIHLNERTDANLQHAIEHLDRAQRAVDSVPDLPAGAEWRRFLQWRLGEAHYFLGRLHRDPMHFRNALGAWSVASRIDPQRSGLDELGSTPLARDIRYITLTRALQGTGLAYASLAGYADPRQNWWAAKEARAKALK